MIRKKRYLNRKKISYTSRNFENPFYKEHKIINIGLTLKIKLLLITVLLILGFVFWFLFLSDQWRITELSVDGLERMDEQEIISLVDDRLSEKIFYIIPRNNSLFLNTSKLEDILSSRYHFEEIDIKKRLPRVLGVTIKEKPFVFIWQEEGKYYYSDREGRLMEEVSGEEASTGEYPLIVNRSNKTMQDNIAQVEQVEIEFILDLKNNLEVNQIDFEIEEFIVPEEIDTVKFKVKNGPLVNFNVKEGVVEQLNKLILIKDEKLKDEFFNKNYIDLRFGDTIYFQ